MPAIRNVLDKVFFNDFIHAESVTCSGFESNERVNGAGHQNIGANPCSVFRTFFAEADEALVNLRAGKKIAAFVRSSR